MFCSKCGSENPEEAKFCHDCGEQFQLNKTVTCPSCGKENPDSVKFCGECGHKLLAINQEQPSKSRKYCFTLAPVKTTFIKDPVFSLYIDRKLIGSGKVKNGFDFYVEFDPEAEPFHLIELKFEGFFLLDTKISNFSQKIDLKLVRGDIIQFLYHFIYLPRVPDNISIKL